MSFWDDELLIEVEGNLTTLDILNILKVNLKPSELEEFKGSL